MLKTVSFIARLSTAYWTAPTVAMRQQIYTAKNIFWAIVVSDFVNETARPYNKYYNLCCHSTMWIEQSKNGMFSLKPFCILYKLFSHNLTKYKEVK